jgi:hypothetical protein
MALSCARTPYPGVVHSGSACCSSTLPAMDARTRRLVTLLVLAVAIGAVIVATVASGS